MISRWVTWAWGNARMRLSGLWRWVMHHHLRYRLGFTQSYAHAVSLQMNLVLFEFGCGKSDTARVYDVDLCRFLRTYKSWTVSRSYVSSVNRLRQPSSLRNADLIAEQDLGGVSLPSTVATGGDHVATGVVYIKLRDGSGTVARNDQEWHGRVPRRLFVL